MAKFIAKTHLSDIDGNIVAPGTEIEAAQLGDKEVIARYRSLEAIEDAKAPKETEVAKAPPVRKETEVAKAADGKPGEAPAKK